MISLSWKKEKYIFLISRMLTITQYPIPASGQTVDYGWKWKAYE